MSDCINAPAGGEHLWVWNIARGYRGVFECRLCDATVTREEMFDIKSETLRKVDGQALQPKEQEAMQNIHIHRYPPESKSGFAGYVEPEDRSWCVFIGPDGSPSFYRRVEVTGAEGKTEHRYVNAEVVNPTPFELTRPE